MPEIRNRNPCAEIPPTIEWEDLISTNKGGVMKRILKEGTGDVPKAGDVITCHYTLTLENGVEVDSSRKRGQPFQFTLGARQVIKAWDIGFASMKQGEKCLLKAKAPYAYGQQGSGPIPENATLVFDCELLSFGEGKESSSLVIAAFLVVLLYIGLRVYNAYKGKEEVE